MSERTTTLNGVQVSETQLREALERIDREKREDRTKPFMGESAFHGSYVNIPVKVIRDKISGLCLRDWDYITLRADGTIGHNVESTHYAGPFLGFKESK